MNPKYACTLHRDIPVTFQVTIDMLHPHVIFENMTKVVFPWGTLYVNTEELWYPSKKLGYFFGSCMHPGCTQGRIYNLFFVRWKLVIWKFVRPWLKNHSHTKLCTAIQKKQHTHKIIIPAEARQQQASLAVVAANLMAAQHQQRQHRSRKRGGSAAAAAAKQPTDRSTDWQTCLIVMCVHRTSNRNNHLTINRID